MQTLYKKYPPVLAKAKTGGRCLFLGGGQFLDGPVHQLHALLEVGIVRPLFGHMAAAVLAGNEDHGNVTEGAHDHGVVSGAGEHLPGGDVQLRGVLFQQLLDLGLRKKIGGVDIPETMPILSNPGEGKTTLCVYIPNSDCEEAIPYAIGELPGGGWENIEELKMKRCEGRKYWWEVTLDALNEENATNFKFRMDDGANTWIYEPKATYEDIPTDYLKVKEYETKNLVAIADCDNQVLYIKCGKWNTPCIERNQAGTATFTLTAPALPEGAVVGIVGAIREDLGYWDIAEAIPMTKGEGNKWTATADVQKNCEYKYIVSLDGGVTWLWDYCEYGDNRFMPLDLIAIDTIESWWFEEIPAE